MRNDYYLSAKHLLKDTYTVIEIHTTRYKALMIRDILNRIVTNHEHWTLSNT